MSPSLQQKHETMLQLKCIPQQTDMKALQEDGNNNINLPFLFFLLIQFEFFSILVSLPI